MDTNTLPWTKFRGSGRCKAVKEENESPYWGRCELKKRHAGDHAIERGMEVLLWSTKWTKFAQSNRHD